MMWMCGVCSGCSGVVQMSMWIIIVGNCVKIVGDVIIIVDFNDKFFLKGIKVNLMRKEFMGGVVVFLILDDILFWIW